MRASLPDHMLIKASGGIRDLAFARELIAAGADRLGTSAGIQLMKHEKEIL
jgi:deoxyribose-phosphate aldolase